MTWNKLNWTIVAAALAVLALGMVAEADTITHGGTTINMEFVNVGNAGNTNDTLYGAVGYNYRIGRYEVTADQWATVILADPSVGNPGYWTGSQPTGGTTWHEAAKFCNWLTTGSANSGYYTISGGLASIPSGVSHDAYAAAHGVTYFIPTENEWYKAAYHKNNGATGGMSNYWNYPTVSDSTPVGIRNPQNVPFGAVFADWFDQGHPNVVTNAGIASPYGTIGQGGNVWEWNEAGSGSIMRGVRGGAWFTASAYLDAHTRTSTNAMSEWSEYGFRVATLGDPASVPEPGSIALLLGGALTAFVLRRRRK